MTKHFYYPLFIAYAVSSPFASQASAKSTKVRKAPNVLFICVDDLRTELGCYGNSIVKTPHLDKLASEGSLFFNHYVQVPTSGASRASLLTGRFPQTKQDLSNHACVTRISRQPKKNTPETFFHQLRKNNYYTVCIGKVSHHADGLLYDYEEAVSTVRELPYSWDECLFDSGKWGSGWNAFFGYADGGNRQSAKKQVKPYESADVDDEGYVDGLTANLAVDKLKELAKQKDKPFCLAVGFFKPHLPFNAPKKYWDLYDESEISLPPAPNVPEGVNKASLHNSHELNAYRLTDEKASLISPLSDAYARKIRHAYLACVSYVDVQIGKVLNELKRQGLDDDTIVVVWGDHRWHLGDLGAWGKHTLMDVALNSTLIVKAPHKKSNVKNKRIVSSVDIYPTLMELCGVPVDVPVDGNSFVTLLDTPEYSLWQDVAYSYFNNGISMRIPNYRYTRYFRNAQPQEEFFEYTSDKFERKNIASQKAEIIHTLIPLWGKGNTGLYTPPSKIK